VGPFQKKKKNKQHPVCGSVRGVQSWQNSGVTEGTIKCVRWCTHVRERKEGSVRTPTRRHERNPNTVIKQKEFLRAKIDGYHPGK